MANLVQKSTNFASTDAGTEERVSDADYPVQIAPEYPEVER